MECKFCSKGFIGVAGLHRHLKAHDMSVKDYYYQYYPRYDKGSPGDIIVYKNYEQYFSSDFNNRETFTSWASDSSNKDEAAEYCLEFLSKRKERKECSYLPSQVELKSLIIPSYVGIEKLFGSLDLFFNKTENIGYKPRYNYSLAPIYHPGDMKIFVDSREQLPLMFTLKNETMKLPTGDYCPSKDFFSNVFVERKSISDLFGTLTQGIDRFRNEIDKAVELGFYLVVVIDGSYIEALEYTPRTKIKTKINAAHIFHEIREIMSKYNNIQFIFAGNRLRASQIVERVFRLKDQVKDLDLEYLKDRKLI